MSNSGFRDRWNVVPDMLPAESQLDRRSFLSGLTKASLVLGFGGLTAWEYRDQIRQLAKESLHSAKTRTARPQSPVPSKPTPPVILPHESDYATFLGNLGLKHIAPHEILAAHRRERNGIRNELPPRRMWKRIVPTLRVADELRSRLDCKLSYITSAYRSPAYNRQCPGAAKHSYHTRNNALDLVYECSSAQAMREAKKMRHEGKFRGGLGLYSGFIHIDTRGQNSTWG